MSGTEQGVLPGLGDERPGPGFEQVAVLGDIGANGLLGVRKSTGERVCLVRIGTVVRAIADNCTHRDFAMSEGELVDGGVVECAWHGGQFDSATGKAVQAPAVKEIVRYAVVQRGDAIWVGGPIA
ncbi:MAG: Rieske 2Fe-2S domain-containing protein [Gemmatimonadetes bacterium]|nr:Rieske 2Fe-2S domain-containing protein [Gemmatimonadota bacterium]